jgi:hypothetical protein
MKRFALPIFGVVLVFALVWLVKPESLTHVLEKPQPKMVSTAATPR